MTLLGKNKLIGITGLKRHGKDTIADYLIMKYKYIKYSLADNTKNAAAILFGFTKRQLYGDLKEVKDEFWGITPREILQFLGTEVLRKQIQTIMPHIGDRFHILNTERYLKDMTGEKIVIADVRFQNEVDMIKKMNGVIIKVIRPDYYNHKFNNHESETNIYKLDGIDYIVYNSNTLDKLYKSIDLIMAGK